MPPSTMPIRAHMARISCRFSLRVCFIFLLCFFQYSSTITIFNPNIGGIEVMKQYPVIIVQTHENELEEIDQLEPVSTLDEAKKLAFQLNYQVIDYGNGGNCETTDTWNGILAHIVTVK